MKPADELFLSIVTPSYNRAGTLPACYDSLLKQSDLGFEWIVIDDGSTDHTEALIAGFAGAPFPIRYVKKENGGKHTALNASHPYIHGRYVLILDSDDRLTPDAVAQIRVGWARCASDSSVGIVTLLKGADPDHPNCYAKDEYTPVDIMAYPRVRVRSNDACEVIRSDLFLQYPFPVFPGERFLSEGALWNRVSFTHKCVYINRVIYLCEYLDGGLTRAGKQLRIQNPRGGMYTAELNMSKKAGIKRRVKSSLLFSCYGFFAGQSPKKILSGTSHPVLVLFFLPLGYLMYRNWRTKYFKTE